MAFRICLAAAFLLVATVNFGKSGNNKEQANQLAASYNMPALYADWCLQLYDELGLQQKGLDAEVFLMAYKGYLVLQNRGLVANRHMLSIADFSQSNKNKRLYIVDLRNRRLFVQTFVSHGKNSGAEMATSFSNVNNSNKSVLGFLLTADTYVGSNGLSLRFRGMERGINDLVNLRSIVVHGSKFVNEQELRQRGEAVNSLGCPAVPMAQSKSIIQAIKGGSVYFIYHPDENYARRSPILHAQLGREIFLPAMYSPAVADTVVTPPMPAVPGN